MRMDIYSRIEDLVDEMRGDWRKFFESKAFEEFVRHYIQNLISGVYDSLRLRGAQIAPGLLEAEMKRFKFERIFDPNSEYQTAYCTSRDDTFVICVNGAGGLVNECQTIDEKFEFVVGSIVHEVGHRLFTDYPTVSAHMYQMQQLGRFFPHDPENYLSVEGIALQKKLRDNENYRHTFGKVLQMVQGNIEDGYIEYEITAFYPGLASSYLGYMNSVLWQRNLSLDFMFNQKYSKLEMVLCQWLMYAKFAKLKIGEKPLEEYDSSLTDYIWNGMDLIDECRIERDPRKRADIENQLAVLISPLIDKAINDEEDKNRKGQNNKNGNQNNQSGGSASANQTVQKMLQQIANQLGTESNAPDMTGPEGQMGGNTSKSITDPSRPQNSGLKQTKAGGSSMQGGDKQGGAGDSPLDHSAAVRDLQNTLENAASQSVKADMESEHKRDLQSEARQLCQGSGFTIPRIHRAEEVADTNKQVYNELAHRSVAIARRMAALLKKHLQEEENDEYMPWQYSGRKFVAKQYCRNELKGFAQKRLPTPHMNCRVYVLVDESGSVTQELSDAEMKTCIVLEQFCRDMNVPLTVQGYTSSFQSMLDVFSYVEEKVVDGNDKYRLTGMKSRGGTPTVSAMNYAIRRLSKNDRKEPKLLFVITDGYAEDDQDGALTESLIEDAEKQNIRVIGCGIGTDKERVAEEFGSDHYLGIDDLEKMPERLVEIVRRRLYNHR